MTPDIPDAIWINDRETEWSDSPRDGFTYCFVRAAIHEAEVDTLLAAKRESDKRVLDLLAKEAEQARSLINMTNRISDIEQKLEDVNAGASMAEAYERAVAEK